MSGVGSTNAMKKGSANNPFLAFSEADMKGYLNSAYTGCIVKYTGDPIARKITFETANIPEHAQNLVFTRNAPTFGDYGFGDLVITKKQNGSTITEYLRCAYCNLLTGLIGPLSAGTPSGDNYVKFVGLFSSNINTSNSNLIRACWVPDAIDSKYEYPDWWPVTPGWQEDFVNTEGKVVEWGYGEDVVFTYSGDSDAVLLLPCVITPYEVGELYKVVYSNNEYRYEEFHCISEDKTTAGVEDVAPGKIFYDFTGTKQIGTGTRANPFLARSDADMNAFNNATYLSKFVKYIGKTNDTYVKDAIYQVTNDATEYDRYMLLPTLENEGQASDLAQGKQLINSQGEIVEGEYDTGLGIVEFLAKTYSGSINDKNGDVTVLYGGQFLSQKYITEVNLPNVSVIGSSLYYNANSIYGRGYTFYGCTSLSKINFSNVCKILGTNNFAYCYSLKYASFSGVNIIPSYTFSNCSSLESIDIQDATYVYTSAFANCYNIKHANFGELCYIDAYGFASAFSTDNNISLSFASNSAILFSQNAMSGCYIKRLYINTTSAVTLSRGAFYWCPLLSDVNITAPRLELYADGQVFFGCAKLTNVLLNISEPFVLGSNMFANCKSLKWGDLSSAKIKTLYNSVFYNCSNLDYAYLPYLELLSGSNVFYSCKSLSYVYMPILKSISQAGVFTYCSNLRSVYIMQESGLTSVPVLRYSNIFSGTNNLKIYVGYDEYVSMLKSANNWSYYSSRIFASQFDSSVLLE